MEYPRILFITVNGWNNTTGTSTISSIIKGYPSDKIANIFIRADQPNSEVCNSYFRIKELSVFRSIFKKNIKTGEIVEKKNNENQSEQYKNDRKEQISLKRYRNDFSPFIRDIAWKLGKWKSSELKQFILDFDPDIIMLPAEGMIHFNKIGLYASKLTDKPIGLFFWDDNFTYCSVTSKVSKIYRFFLNKNIKELVERAVVAFSITPKMQKEAYEKLNIKTELITKPIIISDSYEPYEYSSGVIKILYTGSIYIDRDKSILKLIDALKVINKGDHCKFFLDIYTNSVLSAEQKNMLNVSGVSIVNPAVTKEEVLSLQKKADILLFAEAVEGPHRNSARLSFSTKLTDYFAAGRCILAIAPRDIAPTEYLSDNDIALIADSYDEIYKVLNDILNNKELLKKYAIKSYKFGVENHSSDVIFTKFSNGVLNAVKGK